MRVGILVAVWASGCIQPTVTECADGYVCDVSLRCAPAGGGCVAPEAIEVCLGRADGESCTLAGEGEGACRAGVCEIATCGNGELELGEACDDGNRSSGDGCRADCGKIEMCGDAVVDDGEACDDGNANASDGCDACVATEWRATAVVGGNILATDVTIAGSRGLAVDAAGNLYVTERDGHRVRRVEAATGVMTVIAGTGVAGDAGDGGLATSAMLNTPTGVTVDGLGNVYVADTANHRVRRIDAATGTITTVAGTGVAGDPVDGGLATVAQLDTPHGIALDGLGNLYIADSENHCVRVVARDTGVIDRVAGNGQTGGVNGAGDGGPATAALLNRPFGVAVKDGEVYISDHLNFRIRKVDANGIIQTVAGGGTSEDDGDALDLMLFPHGIAFLPDGDLLISEWSRHRVRRFDLGTGQVTTVIGQPGAPTSTGDGGPASAATIAAPYMAVAHTDGTIYVAESAGGRVRRIDPASNLVATFAGNGYDQYVGDGGAGVSSVVVQPRDVAVFGSTMYFSAGDVVRRLDLETGVITTYAGGSVAGFAGDGGPASAALLNVPRGLAVDAQGNLFIADSVNYRIRRVDAVTQTITTIAGDGVLAHTGDGGPAIDAQLRPFELAFDPDGNLVVADGVFNIRRIDTNGIITMIAGGGLGLDGSLATEAGLGWVRSFAYDAAGNLYLFDATRIRKVDAETQIISTLAGSTSGFAGDGGPASAAQFAASEGLAVVGNRLLVADTNNNRIRAIDLTTEIVTTVAGTGPEGLGTGTFDRDGGPAIAAGLRRPWKLTADAAGNLYVLEDRHVRRIDATSGAIRAVAGVVAPERMGPLGQGVLADPRAIASTPELLVVAGGDSGTVQLIRRAAATIEVVAGRYPQPTAHATLARFRDQTFGRVGGVALDDAAGVIYVAETTGHRIWAVTMVDRSDADTWTIEAIANTAGTRGFADGDATTARFRDPSGLWLDAAARRLYIADKGNHAIRVLDLQSMAVSTFAGTAQTLGLAGDGGPATSALMFQPQALTRCANGDWFIADTGNQRVRRIHDGTITTVLGTGDAGAIDTPLGLSCDAAGNLFVTARSTVRLLPANAAGVVDGSAPALTIYGQPPRDTFPASLTRCLTGVHAVSTTKVEVTDACTGMVIELALERL